MEVTTTKYVSNLTLKVTEEEEVLVGLLFMSCNFQVLQFTKLKLCHQTVLQSAFGGLSGSHSTSSLPLLTHVSFSSQPLTRKILTLLQREFQFYPCSSSMKSLQGKVL